MPRLSTLEDLETLQRRARTRHQLNKMPMETALATPGWSYLVTGGMRPAYGFDLLDVAQAVEAGQPPEALSLLTLNVPTAQIATALEQSGYMSATVDGATLYSSGDEYAIHLDTLARPGQIGELNRVALLANDLAPAADCQLPAPPPRLPGAGRRRGRRRIAHGRPHLQHIGQGAGWWVGPLRYACGFDCAGRHGAGRLWGFTKFKELDAMLAQVERLQRNPLPLTASRSTTRDGADTWLTVIIALGARAMHRKAPRFWVITLLAT